MKHAARLAVGAILLVGCGAFFDDEALGKAIVRLLARTRFVSASAAELAALHVSTAGSAQGLRHDRVDGAREHRPPAVGVEVMAALDDKASSQTARKGLFGLRDKE